jgi:flagellar protein FliS
MTLMLGNPYQQYKERTLSTLAPGEILVKLYEELIKQLKLAQLKIEQKDLGAADSAFLKAQTILNTLSDSLDMRYPISKELRNMYSFLSRHLLSASIKKDTGMVEACVPLIRELRDSFEQAEKISRRASVGAAQMGGRAAI